LNAPPLKIFAPASFTALAMVIICFSLSTAQGPAMVTISFEPKITSPILNTVFSFLYPLLANLNGSVTL
jgi:hypothetical protein